jgi:hypothetical protein
MRFSFSDQLGIAVSSMLTALAILISTIAAPDAGCWSAAVLFAMSGLIVFWLLVQGPREVRVRFGDDQHIFFWEKIRAVRTINRFYLVSQGRRIITSHIFPRYHGSIQNDITVQSVVFRNRINGPRSLRFTQISTLPG